MHVRMGACEDACVGARVGVGACVGDNEWIHVCGCMCACVGACVCVHWRVCRCVCGCVYVCGGV